MRIFRFIMFTLIASMLLPLMDNALGIKYPNGLAAITHKVAYMGEGGILFAILYWKPNKDEE